LFSSLNHLSQSHFVIPIDEDEDEDEEEEDE